MAKFLSETGLQTVWSKIDSLFIRKASVDSTPTANSTNPISSGGMYSVLEEIEDTVAASENALNTRVTTLEENAVTGSGLTADKLVLGNGGKTVKTSTYGVTTTIPSSSSDNTTVPTSKAVWDAFGSVASALKYKGTVASNSALPATHSVGDVYVVSTAGTFAGKACEVGDYLVCKTAGTSANNAHWDVLNGENQVSNAGASLATAGSSATIATVDGTDITVTTPSTWTGVAKTGTVTSVTLTSGTGITVSDSGTAITGTGSRTISLASGVATAGTYKSVTVDTYGRVTSGTNPTTLSGYGITDAASSTHNHDTVYVKLNPGTAEQTIRSGISSMSKGVINLWRSSGDHYTFLGFSNGTTETALGGIGFKSQADHNLYRKTGSDYYKIWDENNFTVSSAGATIGTSLTTIATVGGVNIQAKIGSYSESTHTHTTTLATSTGTSSLSLGYGAKYSLTAGGTSYIFTTPSLGTTATTAAAGNHNHDTSYLKLDGTSVLSGNLLINMANTDKFIVFSYETNGTAASNSWRTGVLGSGSGEANYYVVQYQQVNASGANAGTWNDAFKIGQSTGTVTFTVNPNIGSYANIHAGNYNSSTYADTTPTQNSTKLITSGGIYSALDEIESVVAASEDALNTRVTTLENNTVTGSGLTANTIILGNGTRTVKTSSKTISTTAPSSSSDDTTIPTSKAVSSAISASAYTHPTYSTQSAGLYRVGRDATGHVVIGSSFTIPTVNDKNIKISDGTNTKTISTGNASADKTLTVSASQNITATVGGSDGAATLTITGPNLSSYLTSHQTIKQNGITGATRNCYASCTTAAGTAAKTASVTSGTPTLEAGLKVSVKFSNKNTANSPTLNINSTGAKNIFHNGAQITSGTNKGLLYGMVDFVYDGTQWCLVGNYVDSNSGGTVTSITPGTGLRNGTATTAITSSGTLNLIQATTGELGGIKLVADARASEISATTGGTTANRYYGVELDSAGKAFVNVPWESSTTSADVRFADFFGSCDTGASTTAKTTSNNSRTVASTELVDGFTAIIYHSTATSASNPTLNVGGSGAKAVYKDGSRITGTSVRWAQYDIVKWVYDSSLNSGAGGWAYNLVSSSASSSRLRTLTDRTPLYSYTETYQGTLTGVQVNGSNATVTSGVANIGNLVANIKHDIRIGANAGSTRKLKDSSWNDISYSPSSGVSTINAVPIYREDAQWGDWVFFWKGVDDSHNSNNSKGGMLWKNGEWVLQGNLHLTNTLAFCQANTQTIGELSGGVIGASFYANNNGGGDTNSSAFFINVMTAAGGWNTHETFRFTKDGIYAYPQSGRTGVTGWMLNESDALTTSEIDTILANAT